MLKYNTSREGSGVGQKIRSVGHKTEDKRETKKKKRSGKREKCVKKKKIEEREREKWTEINGKRYRNALRHGQRQKY